MEQGKIPSILDKSYLTGRTKQTVIPYTPMDFPSAHMEVLSRCCDSTVDANGYSLIVMEEMEALQALEDAKRRATEAASGFRGR